MWETNDDLVSGRPVREIRTRGGNAVFRHRMTWVGRFGVVAMVAAIAAAVLTPSASGVRSVRGFDGTTVTTAGMGVASSFGDADIGTQARYKRANDTNEVKGVKFKYTEFADDKQDPATATSEARRLVTQEQVFAIVPDLSAVNPGPFLNQQHVPYIGWAFDNTYCSQKPVSNLYGFGYNGCLVPADPPVMPDSYAGFYKYVTEKNPAKKKPSIVLFSNDNQSGQNSTKFAATSATGAGFDVVYAKGVVPLTTSDYTPYVQAWLTADGGKQPDAINCLLAAQCIPIVSAIKAAGYTGTLITPLYTDVLLKPLAGTIAYAAYNAAPNAGLTQLEKDLDAIESGTKVTTANAAAYFAADKLIAAVKKVGKAKLTPEAVQAALAKQTWEIKGFAGPNKYPASTVVSSPACTTVLEDTDGSAWKVVVPYGCSSKTFKVKG
jgi:ABC-type branched-subunit amino acid transport system substrate-binding protein